MRESLDLQPDPIENTYPTAADCFLGILNTESFALGCLVYRLSRECLVEGRIVPTGLPDEKELSRWRQDRVTVDNGVTVPADFAGAYKKAFNTVAATLPGLAA